MSAVDVALVAIGLVILVGGGELLVRGASDLAARVGLSSLVIGLTVVAFSTSSPEMAVTVGAVLEGQPDLAVGNVVGSNIVNVLLILGASALLLPLTVRAQLIRLDVPVMVGVSMCLLLLSLDGRLSLADGFFLVTVIVVYTAVSVVVGRRSAPHVRKATGGGEKERPVWLLLLAVLGGVALLVVGAQLLVEGAVGIAEGFGVSGLVVGLTVVAVGTSLPELATSLIAVRRGERDLAVGNIVGSNIFNIAAVLGVAALVADDGVPVADAAVALDIPLMIAAAVALLPVAFTGMAIARWEGALFVGLYAAFTAYVVLAATEHDALGGFTAVMIWFTLPLVAITLVVLGAYEIGRRRAAREPLSPS
ncbi:sodium:calcium antiporter [Nocardioides sp. Soil777]|uniref:calcium/sodium antiporter n=1 Tax=Nocardioides sp. Soil777 TaxID=1736409 RepID=UPI00070380AA|nr:calcium/sodium antiporter [Nocardioides sp. Soil777]KRF07296.1 sodium:calcium antiporter [Nocardioides sp. Soil777]